MTARPQTLLLTLSLALCASACNDELVRGEGRLTGFLSAAQCPAAPPYLDPATYDGTNPGRAPICTDARNVERTEHCDLDLPLNWYAVERFEGTFMIRMLRHRQVRQATDSLVLYLASEEDVTAGTQIALGVATGNSVSLSLNVDHELQPMGLVGIGGTLNFTEVGGGLPDDGGRLAGELTLELGQSQSCAEAEGTAETAARLTATFDFGARPNDEGRPAGFEPRQGRLQ